MIQKNGNGYYESSLFASIPSIVSGFTVKNLGNMNTSVDREKLTQRLGSHFYAVSMNQVHGNKTNWYNNKNITLMRETDAVLWKHNNISPRPMFFVHTADCVPILIIDPIDGIIGAVHAGWKGTAKKIITKTIHACCMQGSNKSNIYVAIGPHIGACCYEVSVDRATYFNALFQTSGVIKTQGKYFLDLGRINYEQIIGCGIKAEHIDTMVSCTCCQKKEFYSFRRDTSDVHQIAGFIGLTG